MRAGWSNRRGVALIVVLLMVSIIVSLTIQFNRDTRSEVYGALNVSDAIRLRYIAESGFNVGEALLAKKTTLVNLMQPWANTEMIALRSEEFFDKGAFRLAIQDEQGKINVNSLVTTGSTENIQIRKLILRLLTGPSFHMKESKAEELVNAIKDWIDADDDVTGGGTEKEKAYYAKLPRPYAPWNAPINCIEELLMVKGMTRELFYGTAESPGLVHCMTVFGSGGININTAPRPVLRALAEWITDDDVEWLDKYRRDKRNETEMAKADWYTKMRASAPTFEAPLTTDSNVFQIAAVGVHGRMTERITGVVKLSDDRKSATLLSWKVE